MSGEIAKRGLSEVAAENARDWGTMTIAERRVRVARAIQEQDEATLSSLVGAYMTLRGRKRLATSAGTIRTYAEGARIFCRWAWAQGLTIHQLTEADADLFLCYLQESYRPGTVNTRVAGLRRFFAALEWAGMVNLRDRDPLANLGTMQDVAASEKARAKLYTPEEIARLESACTDPRELALLLLGSLAGLRISEAAALRWEDTRLHELSITVRGKGGKVATLPMHRRLADALAALGAKTSGPVFPDRRFASTENSIGRQTVADTFAAVCARAGVECHGFHGLRHTFGTQVHKARGDLGVTQRLLRHSSPTTTANVYVHLDAEDLREAVDALGEARPRTAAAAS